MGTILADSPLLAQGIVFDGYTLEAALDKARQQDKPLFIDVYTDWCGPCKRMDISTFADSTVGAYFGNTYVSIKANAEDQGDGSHIAAQYDITTYPSLLFVSESGELIAKVVGMQTKYELLESAQQAKQLYDRWDYLKTIKSSTHSSYTESELHEILTLSLNHRFDGKERLSMQYLDIKSMISEGDLRLVMGDIHYLSMPYLKRLVPLTTSLSYGEMAVRRNAKEWMTWRTATEQSIERRTQEAIQQGNFSVFEALQDLQLTNYLKTKKQVDKSYFSYYRRNDLEKYRTFASYLITEYIVPSRPEAVAQADIEKHALLSQEMQRQLSNHIGDIDVQEDAPSETPAIDSLFEIYSISRSIADQLFEISSDFFAFYDDDSSRRKASFWASLAYQYFPYDLKYYDNHIYILESTGQQQEAQGVKRLMLSLPWYAEMKTRAQQSTNF